MPIPQVLNEILVAFSLEVAELGRSCLTVDGHPTITSPFGCWP